MLPIDALITLNVSQKMWSQKKEKCFFLPFIQPAVWNMGMKAGAQTSILDDKKTC